jgi:hypothetical protein
MRQQIVHSILASLLLIQSVLPCALAQAAEGQSANDSLPTEKNQGKSNPCTRQEDIPRCSDNSQTPSEFARSKPVATLPPHIRYPRVGSHSGTWRQTGNRRHALIGALIGFGIGAAIGAKGNQDQHTQARIVAPILFGGAGALIGAAVGGSHP